MINFLTAIYNLINSYGVTVYNEKTVNNATFPYCIFKIPSSNGVGNTDYERQDFILEVDIWDNDNNDATQIETIADALSNLLHNQKINDGNVAFKIYRLSRLSLPVSDENLLRRQLRFRVATYL